VCSEADAVAFGDREGRDVTDEDFRAAFAGIGRRVVVFLVVVGGADLVGVVSVFDVEQLAAAYAFDQVF
jgi:hypothetical protein